MAGITEYIKSKAQVVVKILKIINAYARTNVDINKTRQQHGLNKNHTVLVILDDIELAIYGWVSDAGLVFRLQKPNDRVIDTVVHTTADTLLNAFDGRIKVLDQRTGQEKFVPYGFAEAINLGHVRAEGHDVTNMLAVSMQIWDQNINAIRPKIQKIRNGESDIGLE